MRFVSHTVDGVRPCSIPSAHIRAVAALVVVMLAVVVAVLAVVVVGCVVSLSNI